MRSLLGIISTLAAGSLLAAVNFAPVHEVQRFLNNRRRFVYALLLGAASVVLLMGTTLLTVVDFVIQYEKQGGIVFNGLLMVTSGASILAFALLFAARLILPSPRDFLVRTSTEAVVAGLQKIFTPLLAAFNLSDLQKAMAPPPVGREAQPAAKPADEPPTEFTQPPTHVHISTRPDIELAH